MPVIAYSPGFHGIKPDQIAGVKYGLPMSHEQADSSNANPGYKSKELAYKTNCQTCVVAYELRLRGYDLEALPRGTHEDQEKLANNGAHLAWYDANTGKPPKKPEFSGAKTTPSYFHTWNNS